MLCKWAYRVWNIAKWVWLTIILAFCVNFAANVAPLPVKVFTTSFSTSVIGWLFFGPYRIVAFVVLFLFVATLPTGIITEICKYRERNPSRKDTKVLQLYLSNVIKSNQKLIPTGISRHQQRLIDISVPLDSIFIHLRAVSDRPLYDMPSEQQQRLEALLHSTELSAEEREEADALSTIWQSQIGPKLVKVEPELLEKLSEHPDLMSPELRETLSQHQRAIQYSQPVQKLAEAQQKQEISVEEVLQRLNAEKPLAVILGTPGSGKSTTMRWFAFKMAHAYHLLCNKSPDELPKALSPPQIPILLRIRDYVDRLNESKKIKELTFQQFFDDELAKINSNLPRIIQDKLENGKCLLLFDGLDEVTSDEPPIHVAEAVQTFISSLMSKYSPTNPKEQSYNRFIITSQIVGYEARGFADYAHYTLLDLKEEQIEHFLDGWYPAAVRHHIKSMQTEELTPLQEKEMQFLGAEEGGRLLDAIKNNPGVKRLAVNPFMLTILALIQRSGQTLPHQRIELYQTITRTLLDSWNEEKGIKIFSSPEEIDRAEQLLGSLAYHLHSSGRLLTKVQVKEIISQATHIPIATTIDEFIENISRSGLFIEVGQDRFSFMHRTFQEYYVALHLLNKPLDELIDFVQEHYHKSTWQEPMLLLIAKESEQDRPGKRQYASELLKAILNAKETYDTFLQRNLLFATTCMADCNVWTIDKELQHDIANRLFDLYGDSLGVGRFTQLQRDIEKAILLWLREQPEGYRPPLLEAWFTALCNNKDAVRQEGAVHLLAAMAPDLPDCSTSTLLILTPPLLQLADVLDISYPPEDIRRQLPKPAACPSSLKVQEYAFIALCLLGAAGPAGWLREQWFKWSKESPELAKCLTMHADDLGIQLLHVNDTALYPHMYLLWRLLKREERETSKGVSWREAWDTTLQEEMARGHSATYQPCLSLRLSLWQDNEEQIQKIAKELMTAFSRADQQQAQVINTITHVYLLNILNLGNLFQVLQNIRDTLPVSYLPNLLNIPVLLKQEIERDLYRLSRQGLLNNQELRGIQDL